MYEPNKYLSKLLLPTNKSQRLQTKRNEKFSIHSKESEQHKINFAKTPAARLQIFEI